MAIAAPIVASDRTAAIIGTARIVMGLCFVYYGVSKLFFIRGTIAFIATRLPLPGFVFWLSVAIEAGGGLLLTLGVKSRWLAAWYAFYCVFTALVFHTNFANRFTMDHFFENIALAGGFLCLMAVGPGAAALENKASRG
jgi:putative oxidoreductase